MLLKYEALQSLFRTFLASELEPRNTRTARRLHVARNLIPQLGEQGALLAPLSPGRRTFLPDPHPQAQEDAGKFCWPPRRGLLPPPLSPAQTPPTHYCPLTWGLSCRASSRRSLSTAGIVWLGPGTTANDAAGLALRQERQPSRSRRRHWPGAPADTYCFAAAPLEQRPPRPGRRVSLPAPRGEGEGGGLHGEGGRAEVLLTGSCRLLRPRAARAKTAPPGSCFERKWRRAAGSVALRTFLPGLLSLLVANSRGMAASASASAREW